MLLQMYYNILISFVWVIIGIEGEVGKSNALGGFVGFSQYTAYFYICIYFLYVTWTTCFGLSYFRPSSGPSITLLFALPGVIWLFS